MVVARACVDARPIRWAEVVKGVKSPPLLGSTASSWCNVTGEEARAVWRAAEKATTGATRRAGGIGLALSVAEPPAAATGDDEASRHALCLALNAPRQPAAAMGDGETRGARRRERRSASELGTGVAAERLVAHVTQPVLWEPGVT